MLGQIEHRFKQSTGQGKIPIPRAFAKGRIEIDRIIHINLYIIIYLIDNI